MAEDSERQEGAARAALYIDGFNLYHPIVRMGHDHRHFKWANLWQLGEYLTAPRQQRLVKVVFCTAVPSMRQSAEKRDRHIRFNEAQRAHGVEVLEGHYVPENIEENGLPTDRTKWTEKQTDINVALQLILDGIDDVYEVALLLSADTDQVATAKAFHERLAPIGKKLVGVAPPDRSAPSGYSAYRMSTVQLKKFDIERCIMPETIAHAGQLILRPPEYAPPDGWVHPSERSKEKPPKPPKRGDWMKAARDL